LIKHLCYKTSAVFHLCLPWRQNIVKSDEQQGSWVDLYHSALLEVDYQKLPERLKLAEDAIQARLRLLSASGSFEEMNQIKDARQNLRLLQEELAAHPSPTIERIHHSHSEIAGEYVVFVDANRRYVEVTDGVCRLLGYSREELLARTIDDIAAPELRAQVPETFRQYITQGGMGGHYSLLAKDGRRIPIRYQSKVYPDGCRVARWEPLNPETELQTQDLQRAQAS
jgi:PAS domain S-box-containing protein